MKSFTTLAGVFLVSLIIYDRITIDRLNQELSGARDQITQLSKTSTVERKKKQIHFVHRDAAREKIFSFLYELNKDKKRIRYVPGELIIDDLTLGQNDQFLDLLDLLFEQQQLLMIEIPDSKTIKDDLRLAGFASDYITLSKDGVFRVRFKE